MCARVCVSRSPLAQMEEERREHVNKMKKMEMEMEQVFEMKVKEKVQKLKDSEAEVRHANNTSAHESAGLPCCKAACIEPVLTIVLRLTWPG